MTVELYDEKYIDDIDEAFEHREGTQQFNEDWNNLLLNMNEKNIFALEHAYEFHQKYTPKFGQQGNFALAYSYFSGLGELVGADKEEFDRVLLLSRTEPEKTKT
jgi:hypothetical protein